MVEYLTKEELAKRYRTSLRTVDHWRLTGYGPQGFRVGRRVLYPLREIQRFEAQLHQDQCGGNAA